MHALAVHLGACRDQEYRSYADHVSAVLRDGSEDEIRHCYWQACIWVEQQNEKLKAQFQSI